VRVRGYDRTHLHAESNCASEGCHDGWDAEIRRRFPRKGNRVLEGAAAKEGASQARIAEVKPRTLDEALDTLLNQGGRNSGKA
jgi:hypothetical protein